MLRLAWHTLRGYKGYCFGFHTVICVELGLHLAEHPLMKLVPIYMFSMGAGTKT